MATGPVGVASGGGVAAGEDAGVAVAVGAAVAVGVVVAAGAAVAGESPDEFTDPPHREPEVVAAAAVGQASPVYAAMVERVMERAAAGLPEEDEDLDL